MRGFAILLLVALTLLSPLVTRQMIGKKRVVT